MNIQELNSHTAVTYYAAKLQDKTSAVPQVCFVNEVANKTSLTCSLKGAM